MKIKFLTDFRGIETHEIFYQYGEVVDFDPETAARLVHDGRAELIEPEPAPAVEDAPKRAKGGRK